MATGGVLGDGVKVAYSATSPLSWTEVTDIVDVGFPGLTPDKVNNDVHGTAGFHQNLPGLFEVNDMTLTLRADLDESTNAVQAALLTYLKAKTTIWWRIEVPTNRTKTVFKGFLFKGYVGSWMPGTPIDDRQTIEVSVVFDGDIWDEDSVAGASQI